MKAIWMYAFQKNLGRGARNFFDAIIMNEILKMENVLVSTFNTGWYKPSKKSMHKLLLYYK